MFNDDEAIEERMTKALEIAFKAYKRHAKKSKLVLTSDDPTNVAVSILAVRIYDELKK